MIFFKLEYYPWTSKSWLVLIPASSKWLHCWRVITAGILLSLLSGYHHKTALKCWFMLVSVLRFLFLILSFFIKMSKNHLIVSCEKCWLQKILFYSCLNPLDLCRTISFSWKMLFQLYSSQISFSMKYCNEKKRIGLYS